VNATHATKESIMTQRKLQRCRRALERFTINEARAAKDEGYHERKTTERFSLERTRRPRA
jgi:hypothetical protein